MNEYELTPGGVLSPIPKSWRNAAPGSQLARLKERVDGAKWQPGTFEPVVCINYQNVIDAVAEFEQIFDDTLTNHFAHISMHDYNFETRNIAGDLKQCLVWLRGDRDPDFSFSEHEVHEVADFLCVLLRLEDNERIVPRDET